MVWINTYQKQIRFKHFVEVPSSDCVIGTAQDERKRLKLYLIVNGSGPIYRRNGLNNTWNELAEEEYNDDRIRAFIVALFGICGLVALICLNGGKHGLKYK